MNQANLHQLLYEAESRLHIYATGVKNRNPKLEAECFELIERIRQLRIVHTPLPLNGVESNRRNIQSQ